MTILRKWVVGPPLSHEAPVRPGPAGRSDQALDERKACFSRIQREDRQAVRHERPCRGRFTNLDKKDVGVLISAGVLAKF